MQRNFPNSRSRVHLAKLLAITVFQVREANRYSGLRSLHVVHGDEASAFIIALFPSKALHCRENREFFDLVRRPVGRGAVALMAMAPAGPSSRVSPAFAAAPVAPKAPCPS